jgi:hypothetical protein
MCRRLRHDRGVALPDQPIAEPTRQSGLDPALAELATAQEGVVALWQICELGLSARAAQDRAQAGRLHRLFPGVYAVGHSRVSADGMRLGAVLACGDGAALARLSASVAWGMLGGDGRRFDVVAPGRSGGRVGCPKTIDLRRTRRLAPEDVTELRGVPITTVGPTLLDLAGCVAPRVLQRAVHEAEVAGLLDVDAVIATIERNPGRRGTRALLRRPGTSRRIDGATGCWRPAITRRCGTRGSDCMKSRRSWSPSCAGCWR